MIARTTARPASRPRCVRAALLLQGVALAAVGCSPAPDQQATVISAPASSWDAVSDSGKFNVHIAPRDGEVTIGQFHNWTIRLLDSGGEPVYPARIGVNGGMPGHGHGLPTQPQVTKYLGEGRYLIEGMKFNMAGDWVLLFGIEAGATRDRVEIGITLEF